MAKLDQALSDFKNKISECIKSEKNIFVTTHIDCDGISAGSIITKALFRAGAKFTVRTSNEFKKTRGKRWNAKTRLKFITTRHQRRNGGSDCGHPMGRSPANRGTTEKQTR